MTTSKRVPKAPPVPPLEPSRRISRGGVLEAGPADRDGEDAADAGTAWEDAEPFGQPPTAGHEEQPAPAQHPITTDAITTDAITTDAIATDAIATDATDEDTAGGDTASQDYVTFEVHGEMYAFPMERVQEIIRMPQLVRVPLGPQALEGLANLRGRVLPVVNLRKCCGLPVVEHDEATRVVVVEAAGTTLGFVVDRVAAVTSAEASEVEPADGVQSTIHSDLLAAVLKQERDGRTGMTSVLDVAHLVAVEFSVLTRRAAAPAGSVGLAPADRAGAVVEESSDTLELVSFAVNGQEYALPIDQVQEIVQAPEHVTAVPNTDHQVLGVMDLRGRLLPVVSLRRVFGIPLERLEPHNRIVVVTLDPEGTSLVGVAMDTVREVLRVPQDLVGPLPAVVSGDRRSEVDSVCRLDGGERLVSVLSVDAMFDARALDAVVGEAGAAQGADHRNEEQDQVRDTTDDGRNDDELFVVFKLDGEEYCVDVDTVQEIIRVPEALIRVPQALGFVEGLVNLRGAVLPVVDLRTRLGMQRTTRDERQRIVVLIIDGVRTGFIVDSVAEVLRVTRSALEGAPELSDAQARLVTRVANLPDDERMLLVLESGELLAADEVAALARDLPDVA